MTTTERLAGRELTTDEIIEMPTGGYTDHYQPTYEDEAALRDAVDMLRSMETPTNAENITRLRKELASIACGEEVVVILEGRCAEPLDMSGETDALVANTLVGVETVDRVMGESGVLHIRRGSGQKVKPRSSEFERTATGELIASYMGDGVNEVSVDGRTPDPRRMVAMAEQAFKLQSTLDELAGHHVPSAHEALLLPYERSLLTTVGGKNYLLSADLPWIGMRTNGIDDAHVELLEGIENPVGVKIGADSDAEHIKGLVERLDGHLPGKLVFMLRVESDKQEQLAVILDAIREHAPQSVLLYDIHGTTQTINGKKIRAVENINHEIEDLAATCKEHELKLHGVHLETIGDDNRLECVETVNDVPTHPGGVDPQLNPRQLEEVLAHTKEVLASN